MLHHCHFQFTVLILILVSCLYPNKQQQKSAFDLLETKGQMFDVMFSFPLLQSIGE